MKPQNKKLKYYYKTQNAKSLQQIKNKLITNLLQNGKKTTVEKILLKSFKALQKTLKQPHIKIFKLAVLKSTIIFRLIQLTQKKNKKKKKPKIIPKYIFKKNYRIAWALKLISYNAQKKNKFENNIANKLKQTLIISAKNKKSNIKKKLYKQTETRKWVLRYYRW